MWGRGTIKITRAFFDAMGARDINGCVTLLHPEVRYIDSRGNMVEGKDDCCELLIRLFAFTADARTLLDSVSVAGNVGLVRGRIISSDSRLAGEGLWKVRVERGLVREIESHRLDARPVVRLLAPDLLDGRSDNAA